MRIIPIQRFPLRHSHVLCSKSPHGSSIGRLRDEFVAANISLPTDYVVDSEPVLAAF